MGTVLDIPDLPTDLFLMVTRYLDPIEYVRCRLVSKSWCREFSDESFLRDVLVRKYGKAQEVHALLGSEVEQINDKLSEDDFGQLNRGVWKKAFDRVVARKHALKSGKPRSVTKLELHSGIIDVLGAQADICDYHIPFPPWGRFHMPKSSHSGSGGCVMPCPTDLFETEWTYDSGLLVYVNKIEIQAYVLLDIEQDTTSIVPFDIRDRIVRRIRLKHNLLVFEWAERKPYHKLNEHEDVHRHYVTAFDVKSTKDAFPWLTQWKITFRSEWKLHYLGFPLSSLDCWFSDHSSTHYAVYIWQTNRSAWGENEPIESLFIWDISQPSCHYPSDGNAGSGPVPIAPRLVKKLSYLDLDFLTIRQRDTPFLRKIALDGNACVYFFEEGCNREKGPHVGYGYEAGRRNPIDVVWERIIGIPVLGHGPRWEDRLGKSSIFGGGREQIFGGGWQHAVSSKSLDPLAPVRASCWRYEGMGSGMRNQVMRDESAGINYSVIQCTIGFPELWISSPSDKWFTEIDLQDIQWQWKQIHGDERYLIIQSDEELCILRFDDDLGTKREKK